MSKKKKNPAPFGYRVPRFLPVGYHPKLEVRPGTFRYSNISPGSYDLNRPRKIVSKIPRWEKALETEEFSKKIGYHGDHIIKQREWLKSANGPAWQEIPPHVPDRNVIFPKSKRFPVPKLKAFAVAGPGTHGKNHIPYTRLEEKSHAKGHSFCMLPPFEQRSCRGRSLGVVAPYCLPPNIYKVKGCIEELLSKRISKRGPYDLFTGERFPEKSAVKGVLLIQRISLSDWRHPRNAFKGKFQKCGKQSQITSRIVLIDPGLAKRNPLDPGPSDYNPHPPPVIIPSKYPFNLSVPEIRPVVRCTLLPCPGRYNQDARRRIIGDGWKSCFRSQTQRNMPSRPKDSWFDTGFNISNQLHLNART